MLSISTSWRSSRHTDGEIMLNELHELGFEGIELGQGLRISLLPGVKRALRKGRVRLTGLHHVCPLPLDGRLTSPSLTSQRASERQEAIRHCIRTLDYAAELEAGYVIIHLEKPGPAETSKALLDRIERGELYTRDFVRQKLELIRRRRSSSPRFLQRAKEVLETLVKEAARRGVTLAVEARPDYEERPNESELLDLMRSFEGERHFGYWHDFGAIQRKTHLTFLDHHQWLDRIRPFLVGCHLHDVQWPGQTHEVPFSGLTPFEELIPRLPDGIPLVWELNSSCRKADIHQSMASWQAKFSPTTAR